MNSVIVFLRGGLGNQMFQYACGLGVARARNARLLIDTTYLVDRFPRRNFTYRDYDLDVFAIHPERTLFSRIAEVRPLPGVWLGVDLVGYALEKKAGFRDVISEKKEFAFDPTVFEKKSKNAVLWGRWIRWNYVAECEDEVRAAFRFRDRLEEPLASLAQEIQATNSVGIHVRRGDYLFSNNTDFQGLASKAYYDEAIARILSEMDNPTFYVFSEDMEWCRTELSFPTPPVFVDASYNGFKNSGHLRLFSLCKSHIIANSTFSWWGAWLNPDKKRTVLVPRNWTRAVLSQEIVPPEWTSLG